MQSELPMFVLVHAKMLCYIDTQFGQVSSGEVRPYRKPLKSSMVPVFLLFAQKLMLLERESSYGACALAPGDANGDSADVTGEDGVCAVGFPPLADGVSDE